MKGYVAKKGNRWYAVIYEGIDPITGRERRSWRPAGCERADAERLAARLVGERGGANDGARSLSFGAFLTSRWLPGKRLVLAASTYAAYRRYVENRIVPALGRIGMRRLRAHHLEAFYDGLLHPRDGRAALAPKTVYEMHLIIRGALGDAVRRGLVSRNVALVAHAPRLRSIPKVEQRSWTAEELHAFLGAAAGHRFFAALWLAAFTGMRRNEVLGLRWKDFDDKAATISINRGLVAIDYEVHETRGKTTNARRRIDLDPTTVSVLTAWRHWQQAEQRAADIETAGWMFTDGGGEPIHPHAISQTFERIARRAGVPVIRLHDLRHTHGTLLIAAGVPVKVVSERLGHATPSFTIETYQHVLPGMQADAARVFEQLVAPGALPDDQPSDQTSEKSEKTREKRRRKTA
ncbi:MAG TPA: tyrosine-type recombinase/integrase [Actinomycetota bacterium]